MVLPAGLLLSLAVATFATDFSASKYHHLHEDSSPPCSVSLDGWGYGYDSLLTNMAAWSASSHATTSSLGNSAQGRPLPSLTIREVTPESKPGPSPHRVSIHARTHPREVQSTWVVNEMIAFLLQPTALAGQLRREFIWDIVPMLNPDGVELGCERVNANQVDLESNWNTDPPQPEVAALKAHFLDRMNGLTPIQVALNLHSSVNLCTRFFFFHLASGTSERFAELEKYFIGSVQSYFPGGFENWDYPPAQSWTNGPNPVFPEGFYWTNYREKVMALTYEDSNCPNASAFDSTARALLLGSVDYIRNHIITNTQYTGKHSPPYLVRKGDGYYFSDSKNYQSWSWTLYSSNGKLLGRGSLAQASNLNRILKRGELAILQMTNGLAKIHHLVKL